MRQIGSRLGRVVRRCRPAAASCLGALALAAILPAAARPSVPAPATAPADSLLRVGEIRLDQHNVFTAEEVARARGVDRTLRRVMNALSWPTRPGVIRRELLVETGEPLNMARLEESERNLRALGILSQASIVRQDSVRDGRVDLVVRTQEAWTLGLGVNFALTSGGGLRWNLALTEKNFLGRHTVLQGVVGDDLDATYGRLYLRQNRLWGSGWQLELNVDERSDGFSRWLGLASPYRSEDQAWAFAVRALDQRSRVRWYLSNAGPAGADPARTASLHAAVPREASLLLAEVLRRASPVARGRIWRVGAGLQILRQAHDLGDGLFRLSDDRPADLSFLQAAGRPLVRDRGTEVWPHAILASRGRRWTETRDLFSYGRIEDVPLDASWELRAGPVGPQVGSTTGAGRRWRLALGLSNWDRRGDAFWLQRLSGYAYLGARDGRTHLVEALLGQHLRLGPSSRPYTIRTFLEAGHGENLRGDQAPVLGLDRGLRTLDIDGMAGDRFLRWTTELGRSLPWVPLGLARPGWGVFYGGGLAAWRDEGRDLSAARHEAGVGLRLGPTRSGGGDLARIDLTWDLTGRAGIVVTTVSRGFF